ncbi:hypothetical protein FAZ69_23395 [Trinickia terrae]|uniref:Uncharacterized protein n=1 Tax=Trinickia terrae TaxID=2571161 RepID=A0A4U1HTS6_9BURK|nr:hypothetical protein [Trinickia terrae]TKC83437.1 hypothetical protein FAZ69_23395 [Trinickia terrae]
MNNNSLYPRSRNPYQPLALRTSTPLTLGRHTVQRIHVHSEIYTRYELRYRGVVVLSQISPPSADDCTNAIRAHQRSQRRFVSHNWSRESIAAASEGTGQA